MNPGYAVLIAAWIVWCFFHSFLIDTRVEGAIKRRMGRYSGWTRLGYNLFAVISVAPVVFLEKSRAAGPVYDFGRFETPKTLLFWMAVAALFWVMTYYDFGVFSGLKEGDPDSADEYSRTLVTKGPLTAVRHPLYSLAFIILWTRPLTDTAFVSNAVLSIYLVAGTILEERKLVGQFGGQYADYQRRVPMFVPWKWILGKTGLMK